MMPREVLHSILEITKVSQKRIADLTNDSQCNICKKLSKHNLKVIDYVRICNALGYEVTVQPIKTTSGARLKEQFVLSADEDSSSTPE